VIEFDIGSDAPIEQSSMDLSRGYGKTALVIDTELIIDATTSAHPLTVTLAPGEEMRLFGGLPRKSKVRRLHDMRCLAAADPPLRRQDSRHPHKTKVHDMKHTTLVLLVLVAGHMYCSSLWADTTITYQGRLDSGGQPHGGLVGMEFELYDQASGGSQQGPTLNKDLEVTDGLFQAELDFGEQPYESGRWLQITVQGQPLSPRQRITGAPFALRVPPANDCPTLAPDDEMVRVGAVCIDKYEASVWDAPVGGNRLTTQAEIEALCPVDGQDCHGKIFARSVAGVEPARDINWFQAQQALANSKKRFPTNAEWQMAVSGTPNDTGPDTSPCNTRSGSLQNTGANAGCVSDWGTFDMVGNVWEWVADWVPLSNTCAGWSDLFGFSSNDFMCMAGVSTIDGPGAVVRGGGFTDQSQAGPFAILGIRQPQVLNADLGFRGAR